MASVYSLALLCAIQAALVVLASAVKIGTPCANHAFCNYDKPGAIDHTKCDSGTCQCISSYYGEVGASLCIQASLGDACGNVTSKTKYCKTASENAACRFISGVELCACAVGMHEELNKATGKMVCMQTIEGTKCNPDSPTSDAFCQFGFANSFCSPLTESCECDSGKGFVPSTGKCEIELFSTAECAKCRKTGGVCYDLNNNGTADGCGCPIPRKSSGSNPEETLEFGCDEGYADIGDYCDRKIECKEPNSDCIHAGDLTERSECACKPGYAAVPATDKTGYHCYRSIVEQTDANCKYCVKEGGHCYDKDGDKVRDGCICPHSRTTSDLNDPRTDCDTSHVDVVCEANTMTVCYLPHNTTRFPNMAGKLTNSDSFVYIQDHFGQDPCVMEMAVGGKWCVALSLETGETKACGTKISYPERNVITYQNWLVLQMRSMGRGNSDVTFHTYCQYDTKVHTFTDYGAEVVGFASMASEGEEIHPDLAMNVYDEFKRDATEVGIRLGQPAMLEVLMTDNKGVYNSIRPQVCIATDRPELAHPATSSIMMLFDACPVEDGYLNLRNTFYPDPVNDMKSATGLFSMFQFEGSNFVFFHCAVMVCRVKENCKPANCSSSRGKRSIEHLDLSRMNVHGVVKRSTGDISLESLTSGAVPIVGDSETGGIEAGGNGRTGLPPTFLVLVIAGGVLVVIVVVAAVMVVSIKRHRNRKGSNYAVTAPRRI